jgi:signal transduction histidine kinase/CheY-like chemotaxis protein
MSTFNKNLYAEVYSTSLWSENLIKSNMENMETNFYEDAYRIERCINETGDSLRIENFIRISAYKKLLFSDKLDTMLIHGILRGEIIGNLPDISRISPVNFENSMWYKRAMEANGNLSANPSYKDLTVSSNELISWSKELLDRQGEHIGAINLAIDFSTYVDFFSDLAKFEGGYVILTDSNDVILYHAEKSFVGQSIIKANNLWSHFYQNQAKEIKNLTNYKGVESYVFKREIFNGWNIYVVIPLDKHYKALYINLLQTALVFMVCLVFLSSLLVRLNTVSKRAKTENEAKSSFLAIMSHEIRTPLNAIMGLGQLEATNKNLPQKSRETIEKILMSSQNLLGIINDILDLSRIENGKFEVIESEYYLPSLVNDVSVVIRSCIASKPLEFKISVSRGIPCRFIGDMQRIKQVLNNLLNNSIKYTKQGFVELSVSHLVLNEKSCIKFKIRDSGIGIKSEDIPNLFNVYNRLDTKRNRYIEGTGLGLSITKELTSLMHGTIEVESIYGKGSEFSVFIPQEIVDSTPIGEEIAKNLELMTYSDDKSFVKKSFARTQLGSADILIVDDVQMNLDVMRGLLEPYDLHLETATSGQQAINLLKNGNKYDAIFMDHMMPIMDGIEATRIIRSMAGDYFSQVPVIAFTANAIYGNDKMFLERGFNDFISKPVDIRKLDACLNRWVHKKGYSQAAKRYIDFEEGAAQFGSAELFKKMLASFKKHTPELLQKLQQQTGENYIISIHALKGILRTVCAKELGDRAYELEKASKAGNLEFVKSKNSDLIIDVQKLLDSISEG